jgi:DNA transposition AAA+ family ATPase
MSELTQEYKFRIVKAIKEQSFKFTSNARHAKSLDINPAQFSRIMNNDLERVLSDDKWLRVANKLNVNENPELVWQIAKTDVYNYIYKQLESCQQYSVSGIFCDIADIGKSFTAKDYVKKHRNAIYIDCSQVKTRLAFVREIAKEFGIDHDGRFATVKKDLIQYMKAMTKPLIILDEAGDLKYEAFLEIKALWNATEYQCGWYMMGADGLKKKIDNAKILQKVGFAEIFSRLGNRYQRITPENEQDRKEFLKRQAALVSKANGSKQSVRTIYANSFGSLRRVRIEIIKENQAKALHKASE